MAGDEKVPRKKKGEPTAAHRIDEFVREDSTNGWEGDFPSALNLGEAECNDDDLPYIIFQRENRRIKVKLLILGLSFQSEYSIQPTCEAKAEESVQGWEEEAAAAADFTSKDESSTTPRTLCPQ
jgi:hypothetical protein